MDATTPLDLEHVLAFVAVAAVLGGILALLFGFTRRTVLATLVMTFGLHAMYPGGTTSLVSDALQPLRSLTDATAERRESRKADLDEAVRSVPAPRPSNH